MRCWLAAVILYATLPFYAAASELDHKKAEQFIWTGRFQEAEQYLQPMYKARHKDAARLLCLSSALWGKDIAALAYCDEALKFTPHSDSDKYADIKALQAHTYLRLGDIMESANAIIDALDARDPPGWLVQMVNVEISRDRADYAQALSQIKPDNPTQFNFARARLFPETIQPNERSRWTYIIAGVIVPLVLLMGVAAYQYRARITAFLTTSAAAPAQPAAQPGAPTIPAYWQAWQAGYMNRAYQIAAWCWAAVWILISLPIVLLLAIPAVSILLDFSAAGFHSGIANARGFAAGFLGWGRLWFALLLLALAGFAVTKMYGRYSLPKPFRPRIRVIRTTIRLVFLAVALLSVGTFLSYFAGIAGGIYANPVVQLLIDILRKSFGF